MASLSLVGRATLQLPLYNQGEKRFFLFSSLLLSPHAISFLQDFKEIFSRDQVRKTIPIWRFFFIQTCKIILNYSFKINPPTRLHLQILCWKRKKRKENPF